MVLWLSINLVDSHAFLYKEINSFYKGVYMSYTSITVYIYIPITKYKYVTKLLLRHSDEEIITWKHHIHENM